MKAREKNFVFFTVEVKMKLFETGKFTIAEAIESDEVIFFHTLFFKFNYISFIYKMEVDFLHLCQLLYLQS
jgi:hypothetical protein